MTRPTQLRITFAALLLTLAVAPVARATICVVPDSGGTAEMPPPVGSPNCTTGYVSPTEFHEIIAGLPSGSTIEIGPEHNRFLNITGVPGGGLGGERETFDSELQLQIQGTGDLATFNRVLTVQLACTTDIGPRTPGDPVQTFPNEMVQLQGSIFGDPDFDELTIRAGSFYGLPSPGQTTLTRLGPPGSDFNVDSFFDITYEIDFVGAAGGPLATYSGTTGGTLRMGLGQAPAATPVSGRLGLFIAVLALALLIPMILFMRRTRTA